MKEKKEVVVSLTSFPGAIAGVPRVVRSILNGQVLPDRIVLYLTRSQFEDFPVPPELVELEKQEDLFEIRFCEDAIRSYTKLIPALSDFPDAVIVTVDDDVEYHPKMLSMLLKFHKKYPEDIIAHRVRKIRLDRPYSEWKKYHWYDFIFHPRRADFANLLTGVGGVLYPPGALKADMLDKELFFTLAPTTDDIWFWAAAVANGRRIRPVPFGINKTKDIAKPTEVSLKWGNYEGGTDRNKEAFDRILERFPEVRESLCR